MISDDKIEDPATQLLWKWARTLRYLYPDEEQCKQLKEILAKKPNLCYHNGMHNVLWLIPYRVEYISVFKELIEAGAPTDNVDMTNRCLLHSLVTVTVTIMYYRIDEYLPLLEYISEKTYDIDAHDKFGESALGYMSTVPCHDEVIKWLIIHGADPYKPQPKSNNRIYDTMPQDLRDFCDAISLR
jgi:hypothetical protein